MRLRCRAAASKERSAFRGRLEMLAELRATSDPSYAYGWPHEPSFVNCRSAKQNLSAIHGSFPCLHDVSSAHHQSRLREVSSCRMSRAPRQAQRHRSSRRSSSWNSRAEAGSASPCSTRRRELPIDLKGDERFPMCSTFKVLAVSGQLKDAGSKLERLERRVRIEQTDIVENSPVTREACRRRRNVAR